MAVQNPDGTYQPIVRTPASLPPPPPAGSLFDSLTGSGSNTDFWTGILSNAKAARTAQAARGKQGQKTAQTQTGNRTVTGTQLQQLLSSIFGRQTGTSQQSQTGSQTQTDRGTTTQTGAGTSQTTNAGTLAQSDLSSSSQMGAFSQFNLDPATMAALQSLLPGLMEGVNTGAPGDPLAGTSPGFTPGALDISGELGGIDALVQLLVGQAGTDVEGQIASSEAEIRRNFDATTGTELSVLSDVIGSRGNSFSQFMQQKGQVELGTSLANAAANIRATARSQTDMELSSAIDALSRSAGAKIGVAGAEVGRLGAEASMMNASTGRIGANLAVENAPLQRFLSVVQMLQGAQVTGTQTGEATGQQTGQQTTSQTGTGITGQTGATTTDMTSQSSQQQLIDLLTSGTSEQTSTQTSDTSSSQLEQMLNELLGTTDLTSEQDIVGSQSNVDTPGFLSWIFS